MKKKFDFNIDSNAKKLIFISEKDLHYKNSIVNTFGTCNILKEKATYNENQELIKTINESKCKQIIIINFFDRCRDILPSISQSKIIKVIFTQSIASFTDRRMLNAFNSIIEFLDRAIFEKIGVIDINLYNLLKKRGYSVEHIYLDYDNKTNKTEKVKDDNKYTIGILSNDFDPNNNFYNQLAASSLIENYEGVKILSNMKINPAFSEIFGINTIICSNINEVIENNKINLYINFTNTNNELVIKSMDMGIPCLLGNTSIFDNFPKLKDILVLKSDDDIDEIANKISNIENNKNNIFSEYKKFKDEYKKLVKETKSNF